MLIVDGLAEQEGDFEREIGNKRWLVEPLDGELLLLIDFGFFDDIKFSLSEFISDIGTEDVLFEFDFNLSWVVGCVG